MATADDTNSDLQRALWLSFETCRQEEPQKKSTIRELEDFRVNREMELAIRASEIQTDGELLANSATAAGGQKNNHIPNKNSKNTANSQSYSNQYDDHAEDIVSLATSYMMETDVSYDEEEYEDDHPVGNSNIPGGAATELQSAVPTSIATPCFLAEKSKPEEASFLGLATIYIFDDRDSSKKPQADTQLSVCFGKERRRVEGGEFGSFSSFSLVEEQVSTFSYSSPSNNDDDDDDDQQKSMSTSSAVLVVEASSQDTSVASSWSSGDFAVVTLDDDVDDSPKDQLELTKKKNADHDDKDSDNNSGAFDWIQLEHLGKATCKKVDSRAGAGNK